MNLNQNRTNGEKSNMLPLHLFNKDHGTISRVFQHSFNIQFPEILFHVGSISESLSCTGITLDDDFVDRLLQDVDVGNRVLYKNNRLYIYSLEDVKTIDMTDLHEVDLKIDQVRASKSFLDEIIQSFRIIDFVEDWGLSDKYQPDQIVDRIQHSKNVDELNETLKFLYGRGRGLTPSGDDIIVGCLTILTSFDFEELKMWKLAVEKILKDRSTTDVSESYIHAAVEGYTSKKMVAFLRVIQEKQSKRLSSEILEIQDFGHTSGTDTLLGMYAAFTLIQKN